MAQRF